MRCTATEPDSRLLGAASYTSGDPPADVSARIWMGSAYAVGRIAFAGHSAVNDSTLRRALLIYERDLFDVVKLRRSLARLNAMGLFEPLTIADLVVARRDDGVTADVTIPQEWLSGFAVPSDLSPRAMLMHYGRTHLTRGVEAVFDDPTTDSLVVPVTFSSKPDDDRLVCDSPKPRLWWLRRGAALAANLALTALVP